MQLKSYQTVRTTSYKWEPSASKLRTSNVWKFESLKSWSLKISLRGSLKVWKFEVWNVVSNLGSLRAWSLEVWGESKFESLKVWPNQQFESLEVWRIYVGRIRSLKEWKFESLTLLYHEEEGGGSEEGGEGIRERRWRGRERGGREQGGREGRRTTLTPKTLNPKP